MHGFVNITIKNKDCKGIYLFCDTDLKSITTVQEGNRLVGESFKMQLRTRVEGKLYRKTYDFIKKGKTFLQALEYVAGQRAVIREKVKIDGTVKEKKEEQPEEKKGYTFLEKAEKFIESKSISARHSTIQNYSTALLTHCKPIHDKEFNKITIKDIETIVSYMLKNRAPATVVLFVRTIKAFLKELKLNWDLIELPEVDNQVEYKLSFNDTKKIIKVMREYSKIDLGNGEVFYQYEEIKNIFAFSLTGRRIGEILALKFSDFNMDTKTFKLSKSVTKGKKSLEFNMDNYLIEALESQKRIRKKEYQNNSDAKVFSYTRETPRMHFQNIMKALGLPKLRLHDIRHMLATTLVQNGVPIQDISVMLGHSSIAITEQRYASKSKDQASNAVNLFNNLME